MTTRAWRDQILRELRMRLEAMRATLEGVTYHPNSADTRSGPGYTIGTARAHLDCAFILLAELEPKKRE